MCTPQAVEVMTDPNDRSASTVSLIGHPCGSQYGTQRSGLAGGLPRHRSLPLHAHKKFFFPGSIVWPSLSFSLTALIAANGAVMRTGLTRRLRSFH